MIESAFFMRNGPCHRPKVTVTDPVVAKIKVLGFMLTALNVGYVQYYYAKFTVPKIKVIDLGQYPWIIEDTH